MLITSANAREFAVRSVAARKQRALERESSAAVPVAVLAQAAGSTDDYQAKRLVRVRAQLDTLDARLEAELRAAKPDSRRIKDICDAQTRLAEQERQLSGRPLPGSRRPAPDRAERRQGRAVVVFDEPAPALLCQNPEICR